MGFLFILTQIADDGSINLPKWVMILALPWAIWVTSRIFAIKSSIDLSNANDKNIEEKLTGITNSIKDLNIKWSEDMKNMNVKLDNVIAMELNFMKRMLAKASGEDKE